MSGQLVPLGFCVAEVRRKNLNGQEQNLLSLSYGNIVRKDIASSEGLLPESFDTYNIVEAGDTVLRLTDLQNDQRSLRVGLVQERGIITSAYVSVRPGRHVDSRYLNYFLKHLDFRKEFYALGAGVRQSLKFDELRGIRVLRPPLESQRAIADYLDTETARIDALIDKKKRMIDLLDDRLSASIESVVAIEARGAPTPSLRWLLTEGISDGPHETPEFLDSGVPFISVDGIVDSELSFAKCRFISESDHARFSRKLRPRRGDVLVTKAASVGKVALVRSDVDFNVWSPIAVLRPDPSLVLPEFLWLYLRTQSAQRLLTLGSTSNTQQNISMRDLGSILVPLMPLARQRHVYEQVEAQAKRDARPRIAQSIELLRERRQALITAAVTGEFEVPGVAA